MDKSNSVYKAPESVLVKNEKLPEKFISGKLSRKKLKLAGWLSIFYIILLFPSVGISFMSEFDPENEMYDITSKVFTLLDSIVWIYLFVIFKLFLNYRFKFYKVNRYINILIILTIIMFGISLFMPKGSEEFDPVMIIYFAFLIFYGIVNILFGKKLLSVPVYYKYMKFFAWINIISGVCLASVVLFLFAIPLGFISGLIMALIFFTAAKELKVAKGSDSIDKLKGAEPFNTLI